ncbi:MAG: sodium:solute symporter family transporter [Dysosmobacter sp.]
MQKHFSPTAGLITSVLATLGLGLNIVSQLLSANVLLSSMFGLNTLTCTAISVVTMACYVIFGGVNSTGLLGIVKSVLLYIAVLGVRRRGFGALRRHRQHPAVLPHDQYFNLFARGVGKDLGAGVSVILGVISTQTYVQALLAGRDSASSRRGALLSALLIPPIGVGGILIGYYMRISFPAMAAGEAFPRFVIQNIPPVLSGVVLATLFIAVVGTGAGLALGLSTVITNNIYKRFAKHTDSRSSLRFSRAVILITLLIAAVFTTGNLKSAILTWGFLSMGASGCGAAGAHVRRPVLSLSGRPAVRHRLQHRGHCHPAGSQVPGSARRLPVLGHGRQHP